MTVREALRGVGWLFAAMAVEFTIDLVARADSVTSTQWRYLMSVPGGHISWAVLFGIGGCTLAYGLASDRMRIMATGYAFIGLACGLIAAFYLAAPYIDRGLTTLGYWPWAQQFAVMVTLAAVHLKPRQWLS